MTEKKLFCKKYNGIKISNAKCKLKQFVIVFLLCCALNFERIREERSLNKWKQSGELELETDVENFQQLEGIEEYKN